MMKPTTAFFHAHQKVRESGFALLELLIASLVLTTAAAAFFGILADVQHAASRQAEMQSVAGSAHVALLTVTRRLRQAGNNPCGADMEAIKIISSTEVQVQSDLTGSLGPGNPDKGDPDGDIEDSGENIFIRYNPAAKNIEIAPAGGGVQIIAGNISEFSLQYFDADGNIAAHGKDVRTIRVAIQAAGMQPDPKTHKCFGMEIKSDIQIATGPAV